MTQFVQFAQAHGLLIDLNRLDSSGKVRRCPTESHPKKMNGAYSWDGARGWVFDWSGEAKAQWFNDPNAKPWTDEEKARHMALRQADYRKRIQAQAKAAQTALALINSAQVGEHPYLHNKGLKDETGLVLQDGALFVPMRNVTTNELQGGQVIRWLPHEMRFEKKMLPGMKAALAVLRIGPKRAQETILCEGYATGLSIAIAAHRLRLNAAVLVCFSANNMVNVAPLVAGKRYVYADNDKSGTGQKAAESTGLPWCVSDQEGNDANDDHQQFGVMYVCRKLMEARVK